MASNRTSRPGDPRRSNLRLISFNSMVICMTTYLRMLKAVVLAKKVCEAGAEVVTRYYVASFRTSDVPTFTKVAEAYFDEEVPQASPR